MPTLTVYQLNGDPFFNTDVTITDEFVVDVTDDDTTLDGNDTNSAQFTVTPALAAAGFTGTSQNFGTFETYSGSVGGTPVTFTLLQFNGAQFMVVTSGPAGLNINDTITGTANGSITTPPPTPYTSLPDFTCFTEGSRILTASGQQAIETLKPGEQVLVSDGTLQTVRWIGRRTLSANDLRRHPHLKPIRIKAGTFGHNMPAIDVLVSPQHRIAITSPDMELLFEETQMLATANSLIDGGDVLQDEQASAVTYIHILFDQHQLVNVEGFWSESFYPGPCSMDAMALETRNELLEIFPILADKHIGYGPTILPVLKPFEVALIQNTMTLPLFTRSALH
ncbi:Hint domain-containing protein [Roseovarius sp. EL26]|uniref:Hint domain-containing protein n=1 Tax=Roseovarius sp. EL26 TaxID=2126672 RepID=UPI000EA098D6|nr:Hint domain-containing protein [Roseovarius sp. EL26]